MSVSRETFTDRLSGLLVGDQYGGFWVDELDILPLLLTGGAPSCLVVDDHVFKSVFSFLFKSLSSDFVVFTNRENDGLAGFNSALDKYKNIFSCSGEKGEVVLVDRSTFNAGFVSVFASSESFFVDASCDRASLLSALDRGGYVRADSVSGAGEFAVRGSVVDYFPKERPFPVRVDFSFDSADLYFFDIASQLTTRSIRRSSFLISSAGIQKQSLDFLSSHRMFSFDGHSFVWAPENQNLFVLKHCNYDRYASYDGNIVYDGALSGFGVFVGEDLYVPSHFSDSGRLADANNYSAGSVPLVDMHIGDYVVHEDFGVGVLKNILTESDVDSCLQVEYLDGSISVDVSQMNLISHYAGADTVGVRVSSISKKGLWARKRDGVSSKVAFFVKALYDQYLSRSSSFVVRPEIDDGLLNDFVSSFNFIDTKDQAVAYSDIYKDFCSPAPMDRLLCGDVGFGKTEIAMRAAFIAVLQKSPVVVLCPTTVLCHQLYESFSSRLSPFSVNVGSVSRLNKTSEVESLIGSFNDGTVDVLVCTHRVFSYLGKIDSVGFLVVDEEHKFGVRQKDLFLKRFPNIDILMMSATPIPRTLQSALSEIKTISTISTPPVDRKPIETYVEFFDLQSIEESIRFELSRAGQVYFLHNNIASLNKFKRLVSSMIEGVSVEVIHAKMSVEKIKSTLRDFIEKKIDVLVSTSIIENGLDIPNVNTIIINNAHLFGLSQLHQIRGRVGRHNRQAYAYLLVPKKFKPSGDTLRRLRAIQDNISLGSGYLLSTKDLEIRGAGSVFGYSQSGGSQVGFEYYNKLLQRAISGSKSRFYFDMVSVTVAGNQASIPHSYIEDASVRLSVYRKLSSINSAQRLRSFENEIYDRFGLAPLRFSSMLTVQEIKILCYEVFIISIMCDYKKTSIIFLPSPLLSNIGLFLGFVETFFKKEHLKYEFKKLANEKLLLSFSWESKNKDILVFIKDFLNKFRNDFKN